MTVIVKGLALVLTIVLLSSGGARANETQFHICAAAQNLGAALTRAEFFVDMAPPLGPENDVAVTESLAAAVAEISAAESLVEQPFRTLPERTLAVNRILQQINGYPRQTAGRDGAYKATVIRSYFDRYRSALAMSYRSDRPDTIQWDATCDSLLFDANWHLARAATAAAVVFPNARTYQNGAASSARAAVSSGLRISTDGVQRDGPARMACSFGSHAAWSAAVPQIEAHTPHEAFKTILPAALEVCLQAGARPRAGAQPRSLGCFAEARNVDPKGLRNRDLAGDLLQDGRMTVEKCVAHCAAGRFAYAGVQYGTWCFCGHSYGRHGTANGCTMKCGGDGAQTCGGPWANEIYAVGSGAAADAAVVAKPASASCLGVPGAWSWAGQGVATFSGDASGGLVGARGNPHVKEGSWRCTGADELEIVWDGGKFIDRARVSEGEISGRNQHGHSFKATRAGAATPTGPETCVWHPTSTMFPARCVCKRADGFLFEAPRARCGR